MSRRKMLIEQAQMIVNSIPKNFVWQAAIMPTTGLQPANLVDTNQVNIKSAFIIVKNMHEPNKDFKALHTFSEALEFFNEYILKRIIIRDREIPGQIKIEDVNDPKNNFWLHKKNLSNYKLSSNGTAMPEGEWTYLLTNTKENPPSIVWGFKYQGRKEEAILILNHLRMYFEPENMDVK